MPDTISHILGPPTAFSMNSSCENTSLLSSTTQEPSYHTINEQSVEDSLSPAIEAQQAAALQSPTKNDEDDDDAEQRASPRRTISILLIGVFVAHLDQSLVLTTYGRIASEFHQFESGPWICSAYLLGQCTMQPLYGKLADIYSRRACLLAAYILFGIGTAGVGVSRNIGEIIAARAIQGAGGAGMVSVVSIIVTDIVPRQELATVRSYMNLVQTTGKGCGGVVGGLLAQTIGWRCAFLAQVPPILVAIGLVSLIITSDSSSKTGAESQWAKLKRIDFMGSFWLSSTILALCLILDLSGRGLSWTSTQGLGISSFGVLTGIAYLITAKVVKEPIFPLALLTHRAVVTNYMAILLSVMSQSSLVMFVPIYFQATNHVSTAAAGAYLIPAFVGNTFGGLLAGYWIKRTGKYKIATVCAPILSVACMVLLLLIWRGKISLLHSLIPSLGGFATGVTTSSAYVGLVEGVPKESVAVAASGLYLAFNLGNVAAVSAGSASFQEGLRSSLETFFGSYPHGQTIIRKALSDLSYLWRTEGSVHNLLVLGYVRGFHRVNILGIVCSSVALIIALLTPGSQL